MFFGLEQKLLQSIKQTQNHSTRLNNSSVKEKKNIIKKKKFLRLRKVIDDIELSKLEQSLLSVNDQLTLNYKKKTFLTPRTCKQS